jgi:hypothetical protein
MILKGLYVEKGGTGDFLNARSFYPLLANVVGSSLGNSERTVPNCTFQSMITIAGGLPGCFSVVIGLSWATFGGSCSSLPLSIERLSKTVYWAPLNANEP